MLTKMIRCRKWSLIMPSEWWSERNDWSSTSSICSLKGRQKQTSLRKKEAVDLRGDRVIDTLISCHPQSRILDRLTNSSQVFRTCEKNDFQFDGVVAFKLSSYRYWYLLCIATCHMTRVYFCFVVLFLFRPDESFNSTVVRISL